MTTALLQQALDALNSCDVGGYRDIDGDWSVRNSFDEGLVAKAIIELDAAITQSEQPATGETK